MESGKGFITVRIMAFSFLNITFLSLVQSAEDSLLSLVQPCVRVRDASCSKKQFFTHPKAVGFPLGSC